MLQQPARPSSNVQLPYTTADMAERLAKKKAEQDAELQRQRSAALRTGIANPPTQQDNSGGGGWLSQLGGMAKNLALTAGGTIADIVPYVANIPGVKGSGAWGYEPEDAGTSNFFQAGGQGLEQAGRRAVGDITAIPGVGKPSASPTATDIKRLGVIEGLSKAGLDYGNLALTAVPFVKPSAWGISNAYKDMLEARLAYKNRSPFPTVKTPGSVIDVDALQGSRLPARIVDTPATPATRLAEAQAARDASIISDAPKAPMQVIKQTNNIGANSREPIYYRLLDENQQTVGVATFRIEDGVPKLDNFFMKPSSDLNRSRQFFAAIDNDMQNYLGQNNSIGATQYNIDTSISQSALRGANTLAKRYNVNFKTGGIPKDVGNDIIPSEATWQEALTGFDKLSETPQRTTPVDMVDLTRRTPTTPATRLAEAQTQRALPPTEIAPTSKEIRNSIQRFIDSVEQKTGTITKQTSPTALLVPGNKFTIEPFVPTNQTTWEQGSRWTHYTTPEEAKSLLQNGILATSEKEGTNLGRVKGLPPGTFFAGQEGGPFMEYMATQYQEFVNPNNMTKVAVRIPQDAKILELTSERFAVEELREQNLSHSLITLWEQYLAKATAEHKFGDSFQVAATNFAKDLGFDAVRMDQQIAILPKQTTSSTPYITPTTPTTPAKRLAEAQTQRALPPAPTPEMTAQIQRQAARTELGLNIQDIDFPPKGNELTRPRMFDTSGYGVFPEDAWPELGLAQHKAGVNNTTMPEEMDALRTYFSNEYDSFQDLLRNPNKGRSPATKVFEKYIEKIDNIFKVTAPTTENFKVFRGVNADSPLADGEFVGAFYRSLKEGDYIVEPAYMSTSISKTVASEWANSHPDDYLLIIHAPKGSVAVHPIVSWEYGIDEIAQHMNAPSEQELLFNRGTVLKILSNDFGVIEAEMVPMYQQVDNPISTSGIKESLLKQYSYKDLAEMVAGEQSKADFYVEYFQTLPDLEQFLTVNKAQKTRYDLANTVVELNDELAGSINPRDYWKFRDIIDQIVDAKKTPLTTNNRYAAAKELLLLLDKHGLLYDGTSEFIRNNLDDIFQPPTYNPILDDPVTKFLANLKTVNKQMPVVLKNLEEYHLQELVEMIKTKPHIAAKMIWNQYLQHVKKLPNSNADFIKQVEALPKFFVDGNVISYQEAILLKKNIDANKPIG